MSLRHATVGVHLLLIAALVAGVLPPLTALRLTGAALVALPLLLTLPGLLRTRRTSLQRLSVLLVPYIGALCVEVVARSGGAPALSIALLAAVLELGLLLALSRRAAPTEPAARG